MVAVVVPGVAVMLAVSVSTLLPEVGFVPHDALTPLGRPDVAKLTLPLNPAIGFTVMVELAELPWNTIRLPGTSVSVKFGPVAVSPVVPETLVV